MEINLACHKVARSSYLYSHTLKALLVAVCLGLIAFPQSLWAEGTLVLIPAEEWLAHSDVPDLPDGIETAQTIELNSGGVAYLVPLDEWLAHSDVPDLPDHSDVPDLPDEE